MPLSSALRKTRLRPSNCSSSGGQTAKIRNSRTAIRITMASDQIGWRPMKLFMTPPTRGRDRRSTQREQDPSWPSCFPPSYFTCPFFCADSLRSILMAFGPSVYDRQYLLFNLGLPFATRLAVEHLHRPPVVGRRHSDV